MSTDKPGPGHFDERPEDRIAWCTLCGQYHGCERDPNGPLYTRLIAAAPDLLAALKALRIDANRLCDRNLGGTYEDDCRHAIALADAALAKAEGGPR